MNGYGYSDSEEEMRYNVRKQRDKAMVSCFYAPCTFMPYVLFTSCIFMLPLLVFPLFHATVASASFTFLTRHIKTSVFPSTCTSIILAIHETKSWIVCRFLHWTIWWLGNYGRSLLITSIADEACQEENTRGLESKSRCAFLCCAIW